MNYEDDVDDINNEAELARHIISKQEEYLESLGLPTPKEVADRLSMDFNQAQAEAIAAEVYQPLKDMFRHCFLTTTRINR